MAEAPRSCAACGKDLVPGGAFCVHCGVRVGGAGPSPEALIEDLVSHDGARRARARKALLAMGDRLDPVADALLARLRSREPAGLPAEALLQLGRHAEAAVEWILSGMTTHESIDVRRTQFGSLMKCAEQAAPAVPRLRGLLRDALAGSAAFPDVLEHAVRSLGWIRAADAVFELQDALKHRDPGIRGAAAWALGRVGERARGAVGDLKDASRDADPAVRKEAAKALKLIQG